jgi:hypothetical protein
VRHGVAPVARTPGASEGASAGSPRTTTTELEGAPWLMAAKNSRSRRRRRGRPTWRLRTIS